MAEHLWCKFCLIRLSEFFFLYICVIKDTYVIANCTWSVASGRDYVLLPNNEIQPE